MRPYRVLVVEDEAVIRLFLRYVLEEHGFEVLEAEHGAQAVELLAHECVDVVLMDVNMPVMNGLEATLRIRESTHAMSRVPIVVLSGYQVREWEHDVVRELNGFVAKPIDEDELLSTMRCCIRRPALTPRTCASREQYPGAA